MVAETQIKTNGSFEIPDTHIEAYFISQGIRWQDYREMPDHLKRELLEIWYLRDFQANNSPTPKS
jgi:hypothetical protein